MIRIPWHASDDELLEKMDSAMAYNNVLVAQMHCKTPKARELSELEKEIHKLECRLSNAGATETVDECLDI
jgi:hypothetical protein